MYHLVGMRNKLFAIMLSIILFTMMIMMFVRYLSQERNELEFSTFAYDHDDQFMLMVMITMVKMIMVKIIMMTMMMLVMTMRPLITQFMTVLTR